MVSGSQLFFVVGGVLWYEVFFFFFQAEDGIRDRDVTGVQTCALPIWRCDDSARWKRRPWKAPETAGSRFAPASGARPRRRSRPRSRTATPPLRSTGSLEPDGDCRMSPEPSMRGSKPTPRTAATTRTPRPPGSRCSFGRSTDKHSATTLWPGPAMPPSLGRRERRGAYMANTELQQGGGERRGVTRSSDSSSRAGLRPTPSTSSWPTSEPSGVGRPAPARDHPAAHPGGPVRAGRGGTEFFTTGSDGKVARWSDRSVVTEARRAEAFEFVTEGRRDRKPRSRPWLSTAVHRYEIAPEAGGCRVIYA